MLGRIAPQVLTTLIQTVIIIVLARLVGGRFAGGVGGCSAMLIVVAALLSVSFGSLSNGLALLLRREESVIAAVNFILLPLTFLSSAFLQQNLAPQWIQDIARYNPANWAIVAGRTALTSGASSAQWSPTPSTCWPSRSSAPGWRRGHFAPISARSRCGGQGVAFGTSAASCCRPPDCCRQARLRPERVRQRPHRCVTSR